MRTEEEVIEEKLDSIFKANLIGKDQQMRQVRDTSVAKTMASERKLPKINSFHQYNQ